MTYIRLALDCNKKTCGKCKQVHYSFMNGLMCISYRKALKNNGKVAYRLKECVEAEIKRRK